MFSPSFAILRSGIMMFAGLFCVYSQPSNNIQAEDNAFGSVTGRVAFEVPGPGEQQPARLVGVANVRVLVRRINAGLANFHFERLSAPDGSFNFEFLRAGQYTIEIDRSTLPSTIYAPERDVSTVDVAVGRATNFDITVAPQRSLTGIVFLDRDGDGRFRPGKDQPIAGARLSAGASFAVSDTNGWYRLVDLPAGRLAMLVEPKGGENVHVILDLAAGPVTNRVVNVSVGL